MWTEEWPTCGSYWFWGQPFRRWADAYEPEMYFVTVKKGMDGTPMHITNGHFMYKAEGAEGVWMEADVPEPPRRK